MNIKNKLNELFSHFAVTDTYKTGNSFGSGHIHDTSLISTSGHQYILQKINKNVFKNIPGLMKNIGLVTQHIRKKLQETGEDDIERKYLKFIPSETGELYYLDDNGEYWRMYQFISDSKTYDIVDSPKKAFEGGKAFGRFQQLLSDLPVENLIETIPDFHNIEFRLANFEKSIENDPVDRISSAQKEIAFIKDRANEMDKILNLGQKGEIPLRVTHNDTKFNNILLDNNDKALCVIDLDTIMPGYVHYDFGDLIRTAANTGAEDEKDLDKVSVNLELFKALATGFLEGTRNILTKTEIDNMPFSAKFMTFIMGLRFLTDYIDGDTYYKIRHEEHNLQRARAQFKLLSDMENKFEKMKSYV